jgi:hypothetical protein
VFTNLQELEDLLAKFYNGWNHKTYSQMEVTQMDLASLLIATKKSLAKIATLH